MANTLKTEILKRLRSDDAILFKIAKAVNRRFTTPQRWVRENDPMLASPAVLEIIKKEYGLQEPDLLEEAKTEAETV